MKSIVSLGLILIISLSVYSQTELKKIVKKQKYPHVTEIYYVLKGNKSIKQGEYKKKNYKGIIMEHGYYKNNKKDSLWKIYEFYNKNIEKEGYFENGLPIGDWKFYDKDNNLKYIYNFTDNKLKTYNWLDENQEFNVHTDTEIVKMIIDSPPLRIGIENPRKIIWENLKYPHRAAEQGKSGTIKISFIVDKNGDASDFKVKEGVFKDLDEEALRVVKMLDENWCPAFKDGKKIIVEHEMPIVFVLQ